jgi:hypothetical protein
MLGYEAIPDIWKGGIAGIADQKFDYTDFSFHTIVASTEKRALALIEKNGGRAEADTITVKLQKPKAPKLEVWDNYGSPVERVAVSDSRWTWKGAWKTEEKRPARESSEKGSEASISFDGTGAIIVGSYLPDGGMIEVYLDGKLDRKLDVYSDERGARGGESVWHAFGLKNGKHTVRLVVLGEQYPNSTGAKVSLDDLVYFR